MIMYAPPLSAIDPGTNPNLQDPARKRKYYAGGAKEFVDAWKVTYDVVRAALPTVKFMWCANVGEMSELRPFWPGEDYVDM
jgi:beta-mannanase